jgi:hypothetical protein
MLLEISIAILVLAAIVTTLMVLLREAIANGDLTHAELAAFGWECLYLGGFLLGATISWKITSVCRRKIRTRRAAEVAAIEAQRLAEEAATQEVTRARAAAIASLLAKTPSANLRKAIQEFQSCVLRWDERSQALGGMEHARAQHGIFTIKDASRRLLNDPLLWDEPEAHEQLAASMRRITAEISNLLADEVQKRVADMRLDLITLDRQMGLQEDRVLSAQIGG